MNLNIRIAWILAGSIPPYPCGCLCMIFMLIRKLIIPFSRLCELGGLPLNTWSSSWGWERCVSEREREGACLSACLYQQGMLWTICGLSGCRYREDIAQIIQKYRRCLALCVCERVPLEMLSSFAYQKEKYFIPGG